LVELLRTAFAAAATDLSVDAARGLLKTGLTPLSPEAADELENYILAQGIAGVEIWSREDWSFMPRSAFAENEEHREPEPYEKDEQRRVNAARKVLWDALNEWLSAAKAPDGHSGREWTDLMVALLKRLEVARRLAVRSAAAEQGGDVDQAEEHHQAWRDTLGFLDDLAFAFSDTTLTVSDLASVLESGLSQFTLGLAPPMLDQVLVGAIERSRHPELKAVIILGFNEGLFPRIATEDSIFNDDDRMLLLDAGLSMSPPARQRTLEESLLFYVAATRASRNLVVTYATADNDGRALRPSPYLAALKAAAPGLEVKPIGDPTRTRETWDILTTRDLQRRLVAEFSDRSRLQSEERMDLRAKWTELYESTRTENAEDEVARKTFSSLKPPPQARLSADLVEKLIGGTFRTSVSELETHAACPFQHFAKYLLRLRERTVAELQPVDVGKVHHAILEDFVNTLWERRLSFSQLSEAEVIGRLNESCGRIVARLPEEGELSYARDAYILRRSASQLSRVLRAQRLVGSAGRTRPRAGEVPYGFKGTGSLPAL
ncbi:MAG: exodeoxyribonuclease V subunit gamma, partial [Phycisphaerales bacterium]